MSDESIDHLKSHEKIISNNLVLISFFSLLLNITNLKFTHVLSHGRTHSHGHCCNSDKGSDGIFENKTDANIMSELEMSSPNKIKIIHSESTFKKSESNTSIENLTIPSSKKCSSDHSHCHLHSHVGTVNQNNESFQTESQEHHHEHLFQVRLDHSTSDEGFGVRNKFKEACLDGSESNIGVISLEKTDKIEQIIAKVEGNKTTNGYETISGKSNFHAMILHMIFDIAASLVVLLSSILIRFFDVCLLDSICCLVISLIIFLSALPLFYQSLKHFFPVPFDFGILFEEGILIDCKGLNQKCLKLSRNNDTYLYLEIEVGLQRLILHDKIPQFCEFYGIQDLIFSLD